jgi:hypothetical protein
MPNGGGPGSARPAAQVLAFAVPRMQHHTVSVPPVSSSGADPAGDAWSDLLTVLGDLPARMDLLGFPDTGPGRDAAVQHLARQLGFALRDRLEHSDTARPTLHRYELPWSQWGAPNPDNVYLRCAIDPTATYELRGDVAGVHEALFSLLQGDMHLGENDVHDEVSLSDSVVGPDGVVSLRIGPPGTDDVQLVTHPDTRLLLVRPYLWDWDREPVAPFTIEMVRPGTAASAPPADEMGAALRDVATWVERSIVHWSEYAAASRDLLEHNTLTAPNTPPGGAPSIAYGGGCWELAPGDALVIDHDVPDAHYWNWSVHHLHRFDSGPWHQRPMSCNGQQAHIDRDQRVRLVVAHVDPGVPNWLDTQGEPLGMVVYRYVGARSRPLPSARITTLDALREHLPDDHPTTTADQRADELAHSSVAAQRRWR